MTDWICRECKHAGDAADEVGMGRCPNCGRQLDEIDEIAGLTADRQTLRNRLAGVCGALADAGDIVFSPENPGEAVRALSAERLALIRRVASNCVVCYGDGKDRLNGQRCRHGLTADQLAALDKTEGA